MKNHIRGLRIIALLLFITPSIALLGSLLLHNYFVGFKFFHNEHIINFKENKPGEKFRFFCSERNDYCHGIKYKKIETLGDCRKYEIFFYYTDESGNVLTKINEHLDTKDIKNNPNKKIFQTYEINDNLNPSCILNTSSKYLYAILPTYHETISKLLANEKTTLGTTIKVNPFLYGETSISNIVKRYPLNFYFKPLLYLSVILMIFYWIYYNKILKNLIYSKKDFTFFYLGILSAFFLSLHTFFLGWTFENEFLTKLRRTFVIFFIFFEVLAQAFLIKKIFDIKKILSDYLNLLVIYLKLYFVIAICLSTIIILCILIFYDLSSNFDYILEWNYFLVLLFFYLLSFFIWKKTN